MNTQEKAKKDEIKKPQGNKSPWERIISFTRKVGNGPNDGDKISVEFKVDFTGCQLTDILRFAADKLSENAATVLRLKRHKSGDFKKDFHSFTQAGEITEYGKIAKKELEGYAKNGYTLLARDKVGDGKQSIADIWPIREDISDDILLSYWRDPKSLQFINDLIEKGQKDGVISINEVAAFIINRNNDEILINLIRKL